MTVRHFQEKNTPKAEVWVGSGQSDNLSGQVTIIDLSDNGVEVGRREPPACILKDSLHRPSISLTSSSKKIRELAVNRSINRPFHGLRWLKTVSSTFQDVDFDGS